MVKDYVILVILHVIRILRGVNNVSHGDGPRTYVLDHVILSQLSSLVCSFILPSQLLCAPCIILLR